MNSSVGFGITDRADVHEVCVSMEMVLIRRSIGKKGGEPQQIGI